MEKYYTLNDIATMTGLTTRTLRNYLKMDVLRGEKVEGLWKFTVEEFEEFLMNPYVKSSLQAKNKAVVFDFLTQDKKQINEICTILDIRVASYDEAEEISAFFCEKINENGGKNIKFSYEKKGSCVRVILKGYEDAIMDILNAYYN